MGPLDNRPENFAAGDPRAVETALRAVTQELKHLQQDLILQVAQDITRLLGEKSRLNEDIDKLRIQQQQLRLQQIEGISQQNNAQQQQLAQQLAEIVASQLQERLTTRLDQMADTLRHSLSEASVNAQTLDTSASRNDRKGSRVLLASMDGTLMENYQAVQAEIGQNHSALNEQLNRLNSLQQQGEVILEALVNRLIEQLQNEASPLHTTAHLTQEEIQRLLQGAMPAQLGQLQGSSSTGVLDRLGEKTPSVVPVPPVSEAPVAQPAAATTPPTKSLIQVGLVLALISSMVLSLFNVCLKIILKSPAFPSRRIFGLFDLAGVITPGFGNSLLILLLRTIVVIAVMPILATFLYPQVWQDIKRFVSSGDSAQWAKVIGSGFFLFLSQVLIYIAIGNIPTGIAITIFFIYPIVTVFASWALFGDRPTIIRILAMFVITGGGVLALPSFQSGAQGNLQLGVAAAAGAGFTFAGYVLMAQLGQKKLHPIPFTLVGFISILIFCSISLLVPLPRNLAVRVDSGVWPQLVVCGIVLGLFTLASYLLNNFAIRYAGAALASIIGTSGPALTALFGFLIIQETLQSKQITGMVLVTLGVAAMSVERLLGQKKPAVQPATATK
ncbi:DMT family transporter [Microcoleus sp. FACHB-672]|uniref:DMT family transporter n=1 Tax=Microcoleus sp. FACHB-672 TaxID=2692825 RepID=UPI0016872906|nr:DMT family transporter [Microcoleus sp. FACHB-672]MBD2041588.1 DMT family transporter [Microcoleus sp. FACHB-672]